MMIARRPRFVIALLACGVACNEPPPRAPTAEVRLPPPPDASAAEAGAPVTIRAPTLAAAMDTTCLARGGKVYCFGARVGQSSEGTDDNPVFTPTVVAGLDDAVSVSVGAGAACALRRDGRVACWGMLQGEVQMYSAEAPEAVPDLIASQIAVGKGFICALRTRGDVVCWGKNDRGELAGESTTARKAPEQVPDVDDVVQIGAGDGSACALQRDGDVWCWGARAYKANEEQTKSSLPHVVAALGGATRVAVNGTRACVVRPSGEIAYMALPSGTLIVVPLEAVGVACGSDFACGLRASGAAACTGNAMYGKLGDGKRQEWSQTEKVDGLSDAVEIASGAEHTCALSGSGTLRCWGRNDQGQCGFDNATRVAAPTKIEGIDDALRVATGDSTTCVARKSGTVACWGSAESGALGNGPSGVGDTGVTEETAKPTTVTGIADANDIACGAAHFCAVRRSGKVSCWGRNESGQTGGRGENERSVAFEIPGIGDAVDIDASGTATCVARKSGTVTCFGELHDGSPHPRLTTMDPKRTIAGLANVVRVTVTGSVGCGVRRDGSAACFGTDASKALDAAKLPKTTVAEMRGVRDLVQIATGSSSFALLKSGEVRPVDWSHAFVPKAAALGVPIYTDGQRLARGSNDACAVRRSGEVVCSGDDGAPKTFGISDAVDVNSGGATFCAVRKNGEVLCWGGNDHMNAGVETHAFTLVPVEVTGLP